MRGAVVRVRGKEVQWCVCEEKRWWRCVRKRGGGGVEGTYLVKQPCQEIIGGGRNLRHSDLLSTHDKSYVPRMGIMCVHNPGNDETLRCLQRRFVVRQRIEVIQRFAGINQYRERTTHHND